MRDNDDWQPIRERVGARYSSKHRNPTERVTKRKPMIKKKWSIKKFNGEKFELGGSYGDKGSAKYHASIGRKRGLKTRVVKGHKNPTGRGNVYHVYIGDKYRKNFKKR